MSPDATLIEERFKESIDAWVDSGRPTGGFLLAVLCNDLRGAIRRGDERALDNLPHVVAYLDWNCPSACWGSPEKVDAWAKWIEVPENRQVIANHRAGLHR